MEHLPGHEAARLGAQIETRFRDVVAAPESSHRYGLATLLELGRGVGIVHGIARRFDDARSDRARTMARPMFWPEPVTIAVRPASGFLAMAVCMRFS